MHYYSETQDVESNPEFFTYHYNDTSLKLKTDSGVFSKGGIDFGSDLLVKTYLNEKNTHESILDVGTGYGPVGLIVGKVKPNAIVHMVDVNERALSLARANSQTNAVTNVKVFKSDALNQVTDKYDAVLTNPPIRAGKQVVHKILEQSFDHLNSSGALYVVIQKKQGMPSAKSKMEERFGNVEVVKRDKGYYILKSVKVWLDWNSLL